MSLDDYGKAQQCSSIKQLPLDLCTKKNWKIKLSLEQHTVYY